MSPIGSPVNRLRPQSLNRISTSIWLATSESRSRSSPVLLSNPIPLFVSIAANSLFQERECHGPLSQGPFSDPATAVAVWRGRHDDQFCAISITVEVCQFFCLDNGALSGAGARDLIQTGTISCLDRWTRQPGFDFAVIPDRIDGTEDENEELLTQWPFYRWLGCPVWHMHETLGRIRCLAKGWSRMAIGSSGAYSSPGSAQWWERMGKAMHACCDEAGRPRTRLHGLRMLNPEIFRCLPLSSADSTNVARNVQLDAKWHGPYVPPSKRVRGLVLVDRIEAHNASGSWSAKARIN